MLRFDLTCCTLTLLTLLAVPACSTTSSTTKGDTAEKTNTAEADEPSYADDPMGAALRWSHSPTDAAPDKLRTRVQSWNDPVLLRLYRHDDSTYRAVIAESDTKDAEAVLLTLQPSPDRDGWHVTSTKPGSAKELWPSM